jgi:hypothetical protein
MPGSIHGLSIKIRAIFIDSNQLVMDDKQENFDRAWTPKLAVAKLATILISTENLENLDIYAAMSEAGIPDSIADSTYKFTQIAWGRVFLDGMGIEFSPDYFCFDRDGNAIESGLLDRQPFFIAAMDIARAYPKYKAFGEFSLMSADVRSMNSTLNSGVKPEGLVLSPACLFTEAPTDAGMEKVRDFINQQLASKQHDRSSNSLAAKKKPGWKFW